MRDPKRILKKLVGPNIDIKSFEVTDEPLEQAVETFRDVIQCRKIRDFLKTNSGIDLAIAPKTFYKLLEIGPINYIETTERDLEVKILSLKDTRNMNDLVSVGNLNSVLSEFYKDLKLLHERISNDFSNALLISDMRPELVDRCFDFLDKLEGMHGKWSLFKGGKVRDIENEFISLFPNSHNALSLESKFPLIRHEMELYQSVLRTEKKWGALNLDLFAILRRNDSQALSLILQNTQEIGNRLWQIIYQSPKIKKCVGLLGIDFGNIQTLFDDQTVYLDINAL
ncbi:MAG: hypothetical protein VX227_07145 [Nitrospinota bacterium]|nr:hypothetical protein [Nitrospinota bacterium]MEE3254030.1 hypothetical protein [Nitrospinota bacterium]